MTDYRKNGSAVGGGGGMANPMTTVGDIVVGDTVSGGVAAPARLGAGASGYILRSVAGTPAWRELSAAGLGGVQPNAIATREGQTYWATDAAAGQQLSICLHHGGAAYAWETLAYGVTATGAAVVQAANAAAARAAIGLTSSAPVAPTCVSRWLLDGTGSTITDSVGSANLAYSGSADNQLRPSPWGAALYTGVLSTGECPKGATTLEPAAVTVLAWIKTFTYTPNPLIVFKRQDDATWSGASPTNAVIAISTQSNGLPYAYALAGTSVPIVYPSGLEKRFPLDIWCRVAVAYSAAAGLRFYIDGQLVGSAAADGALLYANHGSWGIGVNNTGSGVSVSQVFDGFVRDVQVCNSVLTATQILADYQQGVGTYEAP